MILSCSLRVLPGPTQVICNKLRPPPLTASKKFSTVRTLNQQYDGKGFLLKRFAALTKQYEDFSGLTEVKDAHSRVLTSELKFLDVQEQRSSCSQQLQAVHSLLQDIHAELGKTSRGEDRYLSLITQEHSILKQERQLAEQCRQLEQAELDNFTVFSDNIREGQAKEKTYAERTKYWSVMGSVGGAAVGILGSALVSYIKMRQMRDLINESSSASPSIFRMVGEVSDRVRSQQKEWALFLADFKGLLEDDVRKTPPHVSTPPTLSVDKLESQTDEIVTSLRRQGEQIASDMSDIKSLVTTQRLVLEGASDSDRPNVVYIGRDVEQLVQIAQRHLEWKMKLNALATVATIYGVLAIGVPLLTALFGGKSP